MKQLSATPLNSIRQGETWQRPDYASVKHTARAKPEYYFHREGQWQQLTARTPVFPGGEIIADLIVTEHWRPYCWWCATHPCDPPSFLPSNKPLSVVLSSRPRRFVCLQSRPAVQGKTGCCNRKAPEEGNIWSHDKRALYSQFNCRQSAAEWLIHYILRIVAWVLRRRWKKRWMLFD